MAKGISTINTVLKMGTGSTLDKVTPIKSYPDLFGNPDQIEVTDLEDEIQKFIPGVKSADSFEFTANYLLANFKAIKALEGTDLSFELDFGTNGADGKFTWDGQVSVTISGGDVNSAREMVLTVFPSTDIVDATPSS